MNDAIIDVAAAQKLAEVEQLVATLAGAEQQLEGGYGKLAYLLKEVSENRYWQGQYKSFGEFMSHLTDTYKLGRASLYNYMFTARSLGGSVTEEQLNEMGISKALVLGKAKDSVGVLSEPVLTAALDPKISVKDLKRLLFESGSIPKPEDGEWMDLDFSCYVNEEEKKEIQEAANAARHSDPPIPDTLRDFQQRKEILLRFAREFLGTYSGNIIEGGKAL